MGGEAEGDVKMQGRDKNRGLLIVAPLGILRSEIDKIIPASKVWWVGGAGQG